MAEVYLYCSDRSLQKQIKEKIQEDTGVQIKRIVNSLDRIQENFGIGIFVYDYNLDINYQFGPSDILVSLEKIQFSEWLSFYKKGLDIVDCSKGFKEISWRLVALGVEGALLSSGENIRRFEQLKYEIKDYLKKTNKKVITLFSPYSFTGQSSIAISMANIIKNIDSTKNVIVIDRARSITGLKYYVEHENEFEKVEGSSMIQHDEILYRNVKTSVFVLSNSPEVKIIKDLSNSNILGQLDNIKKQFDIIIIDADKIVDGELVTTMEISNNIFMIADEYAESTTAIKTVENEIINNLGIDREKITKIINKIPVDKQINTEIGTEIIHYTETDANNTHQRVYMYDSNNLAYNDTKKILLQCKILVENEKKSVGFFR